MGIPRIQSVKALPGKQLLVRFVNGVEKIYDCNQLSHLEAFRFLGEDAYFRSVRVDAGGYGISWSDEADLSEYELWVNGIEVATTA